MEPSVKIFFYFKQIEISAILDEAKGGDYRLIIIDSIQTMYSSALDSASERIASKRDNLSANAPRKNRGRICFYHRSHHKRGLNCRPRVLEHMVDTVLYFDGDGSSDIRILRAFKNRFGSTSENWNI